MAHNRESEYFGKMCPALSPPILKSKYRSGLEITNGDSFNFAVAIIGDGGLTGGMAFEALNHAGSLDTNLLVILNDNEMSISPNVGAMNNYLAKILSSKLYSTVPSNSDGLMNFVSLRSGL